MHEPKLKRGGPKWIRNTWFHRLKNRVKKRLRSLEPEECFECLQELYEWYLLLVLGELFIMYMNVCYHPICYYVLVDMLSKLF